MLSVPAKAPDEKSTLTVTLIIIIAISAAGVLLILVLGICNCIRNRQQTEKQNTPVCIAISREIPWHCLIVNKHFIKSILMIACIYSDQSYPLFSQFDQDFLSLYRMITFPWILLPVTETRTLWSYRTKSGRSSSRNTITRLLTTLHTPASGVRVATHTPASGVRVVTI